MNGRERRRDWGGRQREREMRQEIPGNTQPVNGEMEQGRNTGAGDNREGGGRVADNQNQTEEKGGVPGNPEDSRVPDTG